MNKSMRKMNNDIDVNNIEVNNIGMSNIKENNKIIVNYSEDII